MFSFYVGKKFLYKKFKTLGAGKVKQKHLKRLQKYGPWALTIAAISPVPWVIFCWLAGSAKMKLKKFILYGLIPRTFRIIIVVWFADILREIFI